jgi:hypothetical protein
MFFLGKLQQSPLRFWEMTGPLIFLENDIPLPQRRFLSLTSLYEFPPFKKWGGEVHFFK